jgi:hypothetical protein
MNAPARKNARRWESPEWLNVTLIVTGTIVAVALLIWAAKPPKRPTEITPVFKQVFTEADPPSPPPARPEASPRQASSPKPAVIHRSRGEPTPVTVPVATLPWQRHVDQPVPVIIALASAAPSGGMKAAPSKDGTTNPEKIEPLAARLRDVKAPLPVAVTTAHLPWMLNPARPSVADVPLAALAEESVLSVVAAEPALKRRDFVATVHVPVAGLPWTRGVERLEPVAVTLATVSDAEAGKERLRYLLGQPAEKPVVEYDVGITPAELAKKLKDISGFGTYATDKPRAPIVATNRVAEAGGPALERLYYYPQERSLPRLLGALQKELPGMLAKLETKVNLDRALNVAFAVDTATAVCVAEANLRLCDEADVPKALLQLASAYQAAGEMGKLKGMLRKTEDRGLKTEDSFVIPARKTFIPELDAVLPPRPVGEDALNLWHNHQLALLKGDLHEAKETARQLSVVSEQLSVGTAPEVALLKKLAAAAQARVDRLETGIVNRQAAKPAQDDTSTAQSSSLSSLHSSPSALSAAFAAIERLATTGHEPLTNRLAKLSDEQVVEMVKQSAATYGRMSDETADLILYLIEQRDYNGTEIPVDVLLWAGIHVKAQRPARSIPILAEAQRVGMLRWWDAKQETAAQFAVEAGVYLAECVVQDKKTRLMDLYPVYAAILSNAVTVAAINAPQAKAYYYYYQAVWGQWQIHTYFNHRDRLPAIWEDQMINSPNEHMRFKAKYYLAMHYIYSGQQVDEAKQLLRTIAAGANGTEWVSDGIEGLQFLAALRSDNLLWEESLKAAELALREPPSDSPFRKKWETLRKKAVSVLNNQETGDK